MPDASALTLGVIGARGYTGRELLKLLSKHPRLRVAFVTSRELKGKPVQREAPESTATLVFEDLTPRECAERHADAYVLALPNGASEPYVQALEDGHPDAVVVDLSADHRFDDAWVYGQPERRRAAIVGHKRIANPGCYATAFQLAASPLVPFVTGAFHGFGVSGYSGAGTTPSPRNDPALLADSILPYALVDHGHEQEVGYQIGHAACFVPHVAPFFRGLSVTVTAMLREPVSEDALVRVFGERYKGERLVLLDEEAPTARAARDRHEVRIGGLRVSRDGTHVAVVGALDNLLAGAATTAVRNLNLALGLSELEGVTPWLT